MKKLFKNFKRLSAKQIKTYATVILMTSLSFGAYAIELEKEEVLEPGMEASFIENEEMYLENWMLTPFEVETFEEAAIETTLIPASELVYEAELAFEGWMAMPFEITETEVSSMEGSICSPAP